MIVLALTVGGLVTFVPAWPAQADNPPAPGSSGTEAKSDTSPMWNNSSTPQFGAFRSKDLLDKSVRGSDNAKLGELDNWLIDLPQGRITAGLVNSGGLLGIGATTRAVPASCFSYDESARTLSLNADQRTFHLAPVFNANRMDDLSQLVNSYRQFGQEPYWTKGSTSQPVRESEKESGHAIAPSNLNKATHIIGFTVRDSSHQDLGKIQDFVVDLKSGHLLYAVLAQGGVVGVGEKLYPIAPQALSFSEAGDELTLNMSRAQLEHAPQFAAGSWPALNDPKWASDVYTFYHAPMYWTGPHPSMSKGATEMMKQPVREPEIKENQPAMSVSESALIEKVRAAFKADSSLAPVADGIDIAQKDGVVTLKGQVDNEQQKDALIKAAKTAAGVSDVKDEITVRK
jgi:sporulation protein YlmC with PRC-barrel domain